MLFLNLTDLWRELLLALCDPIYKFIVYIYDLFEVIGTAQILTNETLSDLYNRIGLLLGIYMLFRILISFIQMLINPDYITDKEKGVGKIATKALLVIALIGVTPFLFEKAIEIQNFIVGANNGENVIAKIILSTNKSNSDDFGSSLSAYLFTSFYRRDERVVEAYNNKPGYFDENGCPAFKIVEETNESYIYRSVYYGKGSVAYAKANDCLTITHPIKQSGVTEDVYEVSFTWNGVFAVITGGFVCYMLAIYTLSVGVRVIQLAFLRVIAPMAIMGYLSPKKDTIFEKWLKMCTTTYLDLFIRMAIIYFVVYIINNIIGSDVGIALVDNSFKHMWLVNIVMILALLTFAKKAPELLKELFPSSGAASLGFGLKSPKKLLDDMFMGQQLWNTAKRAYGAAAVGLRTSWGRTRDRIGEAWDDRGNGHTSRNVLRIFGGAAGGFMAGVGRGLGTKDRSGRINAVKTGRDIASQRIKRRDAGYYLSDEISDSFKGYFGIKTEAKRRATALDMSIYASQQARANMSEQLNEEIKNEHLNSTQAQNIIELSSMSWDKDKKVFIGTYQGKYQEFSESRYESEVNSNGGTAGNVGSVNLVDHTKTMTSMTVSEAKAGKRKDALEKTAQQKDKSS